jgi:gliding motility-associated-like protein
MKNIFKSLGTFLAFFFLGINSLFAQCILFPGNLVFTGVNIDDDGVDGTSGNDRFSFVLLQDVSQGFEINFTDLGWTTSSSFQSNTIALTDGIIKWTAPVGGVEAGTQITIDAKYTLAATLGTVSGVRATPNNPAIYLDLGISGDQLFAFTGTVNSPTFIAGINMNQSWTSLLTDKLTSSESARPDGLSGSNVQNVSLISSFPNGFTNAVISTNSFSGLFSDIVSVFNQNTNWIFDETYQPDAVPSGFQLPKALAFVITPFNFLNNPTGVNTITYGGNTQFSVTKVDSRNISSYQWQVSSNGGTDYVALTNAGIYSGTATSTLVITKPPFSHNNYRYRVVAVDECGNEGISNHIQISVNRKSLTVNLIGTVQKERDGTTQASIANENLQLTGQIGVEVVSLVNPGSGSYASPLPGTGIQVTVTGLSITGSDAVNYTLSSTSAAANVGIIVDTTPPAGYSVSIDQNLINESNASAISFTMAGAEIGATVSYSFTSAGGGTPVTGSGTITSANQQFKGIDISGLTKGTITLSLTLTDPYTNEGLEATDTSIKEALIPIITSATYDATSGVLVVTGTGFLGNSNGTDVDASQFTLTGEGGVTITLTDTPDVEVASLTSYTLTFSATDRNSIGTIFNKNGIASTGGSTYNLAVADDWLTGADAGENISDLTGNGITVSNVAVPTITSATYNSNNGQLTVTGTNFVTLADPVNDVDATKFTVKGEGGSTYTLINTADVEISSSTSIVLTLSATDKDEVNQILNKNGTVSTSGTIYNLAAAENWMGGTDPAEVIADLTGNGVTVSDVSVPRITSATYASSTGSLVVTGTDLVKASGESNDILANRLALTGEGGASYTLTDTQNAEITNGTSFILNLSATDQAEIRLILNKNGLTSIGATTYNLAAAEDWSAGTNLAVAIADLSGNSVLVTNVNQTPIATPPTSPTVEEDSAPVLISGMSVSDEEGDNQTLSFTITGGVLSLGTDGITFGGSGNGSANFTASGTLAEINTALAAATYSPAPDLFGPNAGEISFTANDVTSTSAVASVTFDIIGINDAPTVANPIPNQDATENIVFNFQFAANTFNDIDVGDVLTYTSQLAGGGALPTWLSFDPVTRTFSGTPGNADSGVVNLEVIADDSNGGTVKDSFTLTIAAVNDAPDITAPLTLAVTEDLPLALTGISFTDVDAGSNPVLVSFNVGSGTLVAESGSGVTVEGSGTGALELTGSVADMNRFIADGEVTFTTSLNSTTDVTLEIEINDNGNSGSGGAKTDAVNLTLTVTAVNDAPVNTVPADQQVDQNATLTMSSGNANQISISDVDAGGGTVEVSLSPTNGVLTLAGVTGLSFTTGDGTADGSMTFRGSIANINTAITTLTFYPTPDYNGLATITITTSDLGLNGSGGPQADTDLISITINAINPVVTSVSSTTTNGLYKIGDLISIQVRFDQNVTVDTDLGTPTLSLETGTTDALATYASGSGTNILTFQYTVQEGNSTADLDYIGTTALLLNGGKITNAETLNALLTLPAPSAVNSLSANSSLSIDGVRPTVNIVVNDTALSIGETTTVTITFSEAVSGLDAGDFTVPNGTLSGLSSADGGRTWSATFTPNTNIQDAADLITLDKTGLVDLAGNAGVGTTDSNNYAIDTSRPTASVVVVDTQLTSGETTTVTITFSDAVTGLTILDFTVANGSLSELSSDDGGITWTATLAPDSGVEDATNVIALDNLGYADQAGNTGTGTTDSNNYAIDTSRPTATVVVSDTQLSAGETSLITITFTEAVNGLTLDDFTIQNGSLSELSSSDGGITWTATLTPDSGVDDATNVITLDNTGYQDLAGNTGSGISNSNNYSVDNTLPTGYSVSIVPDRINGVNQNDFRFNLIDGEIGTTYSYSISSSGGGTPVTGNGTVTNVNQLIEGINVSTLPDGELTLSVTLIDPFGNEGLESSDTVEKLLPAILTIRAITQADEAGTEGEFEVLTSNLFAANTSVTIAVSGTAINGTDYTTIGRSFVFPANTNSVIIPVSLIDDIDVEGNETVIISLVETNNLLVSVGSPAEATVTITDNDVPSQLTITPTVNQNKVYGQTDPGFTFTASGFNPGDDESIITGLLTREIGDNVGLYDFEKGSLEAGANYFIVLSPATFEITPATLIVNATADQAKIYGATDPTFTYQATGFENGDTESILSGTLARVAGEIVGTYAINQGNLTAGDNYTISYTGADFAITAKTLTVTVDENQTKVYGATDPTFTYQATGFENGDTESILSGTLARVAGETVGIYAINQGSLTAGDNYTISYTGADFAITAKTLTITANSDQSKIYGATDPTFTYQATGFENGDTESILSGTLARVAGETVGTYAINQGSLTAGDNYTISYTGADFAITAKTLTITVDADQSKIYGTTDPTLTYQATDFENGDTESILSGTLARASGETVGTYAINQGSLTAGDNYTISYTGADFVITAKTLSITANSDQSKIYGAADPTFTYQATGFENGDTESILSGTLARVAGETVGTYAINQGSLTAGDNYTISYTGADFAITAKTLTITANSDQSKIYGAADPTFTYQVSGFENGDDATILTGTLARTAGETVGTYAINQGSLTAGDNYTISYTGADFAITSKTLAVTVDENQTKVYGATDPTFTYQATGFENGDSESVLTGSLARVAGETVGTYAINQGSLSAGDNYTISYTGADFAVTQANLVLTADDKSKTYGEANPALTFTYAGLVNGDTKLTTEPEISTTATVASNVGTYPITLTGGADQNYAITLVNGTLTIGQKALTITADDKQKTYGDANPTLTFTYAGLVNGDTKLTTEPGISTTATASSNVGTYPITLTGGADQNYAITLVNGTLTIGQKALMITADDKQKIYGDANPALTFTYAGLVNGDTKVITEPGISTTATASSNVGTYPITLTGGADQNYAVTLVNGTLTIGQKSLTITADDKQKTYGDSNPALTFSYAGLVNGDTKLATEPGISTTATASSNAGTYTIVLNGGADQNYTIKLVNGTLTIGKKDLTITAEDKSKTYGEANPALTFTYAGLVNGDTKLTTEPSISTTASESSNVGTYPITLNGGADQNYTITLMNGTLTIGKKDLTITADDQQKTYGDANPALTFTYAGLVNGDTKLTTEPGISTTATAGSNVGTYPIILTGGTDQNYAITLVNGTMTIGQKALTITAGDKQKTYGDANPTLTFSYSGLVNGDTKVITEPAISSTATASSNVGTYPITLIGGSDQNYAITLVNGTLTINKATLRIEANAQSKVFGAADPELTFIVTGYKGTDTEMLLTGIPVREAGEAVGIYSIEIGTLNAGSNYQIEYLSAQFEIVPAELISLTDPVLIQTPWSVNPTLPTTLFAVTADGQVVELAVTWNLTNLDLFKRGKYNLTGTVTMPAGILNPEELTATLEVEVLAKGTPQDLILSNNSFDPDPDDYFQEIGNFQVIDPLDQTHFISLVPGAADNQYFEVIDGILFWSSAEEVAGKTEFQILVRVEDRDGNVIERSFTIIRGRQDINDLEVLNTFTPNGDGINDTWGVPDLRYFKGVRVQVFDRNGERLFYTEDADKRWDGTYKGKEMPVGTYFWVVEVIETGQVRRGSLTLLRN